MEYETVIGLEVHAHLNTKSKIFCGCSTKFGASPNTQVCPVCLGLPGVLPVLNKESLRKAVFAALALNCKIAKFSKFDRKQYFYPDLPKNYQISQYDIPISYDGWLTIMFEGKEKKIGIVRVHMEEDAGKLIHSGKEKAFKSFVDFNRTGVPLIEIVSNPDIRTPKEAHEYLLNLKSILKYIDVSDCNMEEGSLRCDANISVRPAGQKELGVKIELKNMNSFKAVKKALEYESKRQIEFLKENEKLFQETRLWDEDKNITKTMRIKEEANDYRYFPEPDLVPIELSDKYIDNLKKSLPELPYKRFKRFKEEYKLPEYDCRFLTSEREIADYFEECIRLYDKPKNISNWIMGEIMKLLNEKNIPITEFAIGPEKLTELLKLIDRGSISSSAAKRVFEELEKSPSSKPEEIVKKLRLSQVSDVSSLEKIIDEVLQEEHETVEKYKQGKTKVIAHLIGMVMRKSNGKANPKMVNQILLKKLSA